MPLAVPPLDIVPPTNCLRISLQRDGGFVEGLELAPITTLPWSQARLWQSSWRVQIVSHYDGCHPALPLELEIRSLISPDRDGVGDRLWAHRGAESPAPGRAHAQATRSAFHRDVEASYRRRLPCPPQPALHTPVPTLGPEHVLRMSSGKATFSATVSEIVERCMLEQKPIFFLISPSGPCPGRQCLAWMQIDPESGVFEPDDEPQQHALACAAASSTARVVSRGPHAN